MTQGTRYRFRKPQAAVVRRYLAIHHPQAPVELSGSLMDVERYLDRFSLDFINKSGMPQSRA